MSKTSKIQARCSDKFKRDLELAASYKGVSETDFIIEAVEKEIKKYHITFDKLPVSGKLTKVEIKKIDKIKDLTKMEDRNGGYTWFNQKAEIALQIDENNEIIKGYLTNKSDF